MGGVLRTVVTVHTASGPLHVGPGPVGDDIAGLITNPNVWEEPPDSWSALDRPAKNASRDDWCDYLDDLGIGYDESDSRADLIAKADG